MPSAGSNRLRGAALFCSIVLAMLSLTPGCGCVRAEEWATVRWVNDGDTVVLEDGRRVRYIGIDTPEVANRHKNRPAEPFGNEALKFNQNLVLGRQVRLVFDREKTDHYGRLLAYCYLPDGSFVNRQILLAGLGHVLSRSPNLRHARQLLKAQRRAMQSGRGLWRHWVEPGEPLIGNKRSKRFHRLNCPRAKRIHPKNHLLFERRWDAFWAGFAPAGGCRP